MKIFLPTCLKNWFFEFSISDAYFSPKFGLRDFVEVSFTLEFYLFHPRRVTPYWPSETFSDACTYIVLKWESRFTLGLDAARFFIILKTTSDGIFLSHSLNFCTLALNYPPCILYYLHIDSFFDIICIFGSVEP